MQKLLKALSRLSLCLFFKPVMGSRLPLGFQRRWFVGLARLAGRPRGIERSEVWVGSMPMSRLRKPSGDQVGAIDPAERDAVLYVHGGGFVAGGGETYIGLASWLADATGADVYMPGYRLAPEDPQPAPTDDIFAAYRAVIELGHEPGRLAVIGESAGAALAVETMRSVREMGLPSPAALVLISPWLDLSLSGASVASVGDRDPALSRRWLTQGAREHAAGLHVDDPRISPLFADLRTLPPTLVQVGTDEILLDDSTRFADRAYAAGVEVELQRFEGFWHDFQLYAKVLAPARGALADIDAFLRRHFTSR
jgi:monoterpene epsilon-lactone hydrolase